MGLIQEVEGIFGHGKKAGQTQQNAIAIAKAIDLIEQKIALTDQLVQTVGPFASEFAGVPLFIAGEKIVAQDAKAVLDWLKHLLPVDHSPVTVVPVAPSPSGETQPAK